MIERRQGVSGLQGKHDFFVFEAKRHRLQKTLSDLSSHDPEIHTGSQTGILNGLLNCLGTTSADPSLEVLRFLTRSLARVNEDLKRKQRVKSSYEPHIFRQLVVASSDLARKRGLIP